MHSDKIVIPELIVVGAGPGDPELLTIKAYKALQQAAVVLYDNLANKELLDITSDDCEKEYVGKLPYGNYTPQETIHQLILEKAFSKGKVIRLKGGDPFIFGRGFEEILFARSHGIITSYIIDKGEDEGLLAGMAIMSQEGIVGQITETAKTWSIVETLSSENISIHVTTAEDKQNSGILEGHIGSGQKQMAKISYLPIDSSIKAGDSLVTSGLGKFYPPDFYIGEVVRVDEDKGNLMKTAIVETAVNFNDARMLFVILPKNIEDVEY